MDSRPGSTRLTPVHTRCCHEFEATSARLRRCRQAASLDRHRSLTMHETCSICLTKYGAMAKLTTTASVGSYTTVNVHRHGNTLHQRHSLGRSGVRTSCTRPLSRAFLTSPTESVGTRAVPDHPDEVPAGHGQQRAHLPPHRHLPDRRPDREIHRWGDLHRALGWPQGAQEAGEVLQPSPKLPLPQCGVNSTLFMRGQRNQ
jgi:hypothetical protein